MITIAGIEVFVAGVYPIARPDQAVIGRERRFQLGRSEIGEHQPMRLVRRIGAVTQPILERAVRALGRGFKDRSVDVEQPSVVAAADASIADQTEFERGAAVRTM